MSDYKENVIFNDPREIKSARDESGANVATVGVHGVTKIEAYREYGTLDHYPCLMIWEGDFLSRRVSAVGLAIEYRRPTHNGGESE